MSKYAFLITSAINTKFGVYTSEQRLLQTLDTILSIRQRVPDSKIFLLEMAAVPLTAEQTQILNAVVDNIIDFTSDPGVIGLYNSTDNWDVVKNVTEVMCFANALQRLHTDAAQFGTCQRVFKISGRYTLSDQFDIAYYNQYKIQTHIIVGASKPSQFPLSTTLVDRQYMSRLWSWPVTLTDEIIDSYNQGLAFIAERLQAGGYVDIEHVLYKFLDHDKITELPVIGVAGNIGPNGAAVKE